MSYTLIGVILDLALGRKAPRHFYVGVTPPPPPQLGVYPEDLNVVLVKAGVHLKAVFTPLKIGQMEISCSHFKQYKNPPFNTQINVSGCFMNFWVIFRYIWKEIIFLEGLVKLKEIRNVEDLGMF